MESVRIALPSTLIREDINLCKHRWTTYIFVDLLIIGTCARHSSTMLSLKSIEQSEMREWAYGEVNSEATKFKAAKSRFTRLG